MIIGDCGYSSGRIFHYSIERHFICLPIHGIRLVCSDFGSIFLEKGYLNRRPVGHDQWRFVTIVFNIAKIDLPAGIDATLFGMLVSASILYLVSIMQTSSKN